MFVKLHLLVGLPKALNLEILYDGPPDPIMVREPALGGYAQVVPVNLATPREVYRQYLHSF